MNDHNKDKGPGAGLALIAIPAMIVCCLGLTLLAGGALGGFLAWLSDGGAVTIGLAAIAGALGIYFYKTKGARRNKDQTADTTSRDT